MWQGPGRMIAIRPRFLTLASGPRGELASFGAKLPDKHAAIQGVYTCSFRPRGSREFDPFAAGYLM